MFFKKVVGSAGEGELKGAIEAAAKSLGIDLTRLEAENTGENQWRVCAVTSSGDNVSALFRCNKKPDVIVAVDSGAEEGTLRYDILEVAVKSLGTPLGEVLAGSYGQNAVDGVTKNFLSTKGSLF